MACALSDALIQPLAISTQTQSQMTVLANIALVILRVDAQT
jgi:hypothetical protein